MSLLEELKSVWTEVPKKTIQTETEVLDKRIGTSVSKGSPKVIIDRQIEDRRSLQRELEVIEQRNGTLRVVVTGCPGTGKKSRIFSSKHTRKPILYVNYNISSYDLRAKQLEKDHEKHKVVFMYPFEVTSLDPIDIAGYGTVIVNFLVHDTGENSNIDEEMVPVLRRFVSADIFVFTTMFPNTKEADFLYKNNFVFLETGSKNMRCDNKALAKKIDNEYKYKYEANLGNELKLHTVAKWNSKLTIKSITGEQLKHVFGPRDYLVHVVSSRHFPPEQEEISKKIRKAHPKNSDRIGSSDLLVNVEIKDDEKLYVFESRYERTYRENIMMLLTRFTSMSQLVCVRCFFKSNQEHHPIFNPDEQD